MDSNSNNFNDNTNNNFTNARVLTNAMAGSYWIAVAIESLTEGKIDRSLESKAKVKKYMTTLRTIEGALAKEALQTLVYDLNHYNSLYEHFRNTVEAVTYE